MVKPDRRELEAATSDEAELPADDGFFAGRHASEVWEALTHSYRQLASGLRMRLEGHEEDGNAMAAAAVRQIRTLGIQAVFLQDEAVAEDGDRHRLAAMFRTCLAMSAMAERGKALCLATMRRMDEEKGSACGP